MLEVFTIGGGEYIVNVLNAVAAWTGGGGWRAMIRVVMVIGLAYSLLVVAFSLNWKAWFNWFLASTLMYGVLIVPTTSVKVTDRINPGLAPAIVANVPIGLAAIASFSSQVGDWLTQQAETVFVMPDALQYRTNGIIYGARLYDRTRDFRFRDPRTRANLTEYFRQCLFYDFLLGQRDPAEVMASTNVLAAMGPGSPARAMNYWNADGTSNIVTCAVAYATLAGAAGIPAKTDEELTRAAPGFFPDMTAAAAKAKLEADLPAVAAQFHGSTQTAAEIFQQRALTDAFLEARANLSGADGDTFAMMRAETQARNTYTSIAQQAMAWVPLLNIVLVVVFYAMFPVIFPLFLLPQTGVPAARGYLTGFFYLAAWGPLYAVLHMFIMGREDAAMAATAPGGITMATIEGIDAVNADTATIAGFLMMSIPFLAGGLAKGAMTISSQATSMLAPAQSAAEAAAVERTTGNYAYGNQSYQNLTGNVVQRDQWNTAPAFSGGAGRSTFVNDNGTQYGVTADGTTVFDNRPGISSLGFNAAVSRSTMAEVSVAASELEARRSQLTNARQQRVSALERRGFSTSGGVRSSNGSEASEGTGQTAGEAQSFSKSRGSTEQTGTVSDIAQSTEATRTAQDQYSSGTSTNLSLSGALGISGGGARGGGAKRSTGTSSTGISGNLGVDARESVNFSDGVSTARSSRSVSTSSESHRESEDASQDFRRSQEAFSRATSVSRGEEYAENRSFQERTVEEIRSIDRQLSEIEEASRSLGTTWSLREGGGLQIGQDMGQAIASRYEDYARNADFRALEAPSLQAVDLTPTQMRARDVIVDRIARDYAEAIMEPVRNELDTRDHLQGELVSPPIFDGADLSRPLGGADARPRSKEVGHFVDADATIAAAIDQGKHSIDARHAASISQRASAVEGSLNLNDKSNEKMNSQWMNERNK
jgi:conjugal transfer mating pair stabilization protein TraG